VKLAHRLRQLGLTSYFAYYRYLLKPEGIKELQHLTNTITIDTTEFFRGKRQFKLLREHILPGLIRQKNKKNVSGFGHQDVPPDWSLTV